MLYRFITTGYPDFLAYASAFVTAIWLFVDHRYTAALPGFIAVWSPDNGIVFSAFTGAVLICKYICLDGTATTISQLSEEKERLEGLEKVHDLTVVALNKKTAGLDAEIREMRTRIITMEENSPAVQLSEIRKKLRASEEDKKSALIVLVKNLQMRLTLMRDVHDPQLLFAADVLRQEVELVENELKRGELSYYELCLKIVDISDNLIELTDITSSENFDHSTKQSSVAETWLNFIRANDNSDPAAVERSFKFFKFAFHPDRFSSESLKVEASRYFQHSINAHNTIKRKDQAAP
jgi:hypothetical protein